MANGASTTNYLSFDPLGRVLSSCQTTGGQSYPSFHYSYNLAGGLEGYTFPSTRFVTSCYDSLGRLTAAHKGDQNAAIYASATAFWPHGAIQTLSLGNNITESTTFNVRLQPTAISAANGTTSLLSIAYGYGPANNGNVTSQSVQFPSRVAADNNVVPALNVSTTYGYDAFNRINSAIETPVGSGTPTWTQGYNYDAFGNRAASGYIPYPSLTPQNLATYSGNRWLPGGIGYDGNGNQNVMQQSSFTYDAENRVKTASVPNVSAISYSYDGAGQRVQKTIGSSTTTYVYDAMGQLAAEYGVPTDSGTTYLTADHLGSTRMLTNSSGAVKKRYDYFPFGEDIQANLNLGRSTEDYGSGMYPSPPGLQTLDFTGKERDAETGLDYFGARYFSAAQGRFTIPDPESASASLTDPQRWNAYSYAVNNPLAFEDPDGRNPLLVTAAVGAGVGALVGGGFELGRQLIENGGSLDQVHWKSVGTAALGGAVTGGIAGGTLGLGTALGLTFDATAIIAINGGANVIGGEVERRADVALGNRPELTLEEEVLGVTIDGIAGGMGGLRGARIAEALYPLPNVRKELAVLQFAHRRSTRAMQIQSFNHSVDIQAALNALTAGIQGGVRTSTYTGLVITIVGNASPNARPKKKEPMGCVTTPGLNGGPPDAVCK